MGSDERPNEAFVGSGTAQVVTDSSGNCLRTSSWTPDKTIEGCGKVVKPAPVALFAFGSVLFKREDQPDDLEKFAERARRLSSLEVVQIVGHTDNVGPSAYNQRLSEQRADSIKVFLVKSGVDPAKIAILGVGERMEPTR